MSSRVRFASISPSAVRRPIDDTIGAFALGCIDVGLHGGKLVIIEEKVAAARPDDDVKTDAADGARLADGAEARRDAALQEVGAELNAMRSRLPRRADAGNGVDAYLENHERPPVRPIRTA